MAAAAVLCVLPAVPSAHARQAPGAAMVVDANTGNVLHAEAASELRYPASLTKMMTLYLLFERIEQGKLSYTSKIRFSEAAAAAAPSKLGIQPGGQITVIEAIKALVTKSANDVAIAVAEHLAGSEAAFARTMTARARAMGMTRTVFRNASGLPDPGQVTTARDMLVLSLRLYDDFPRHYRHFSQRYYTFRGRRYRNHNGLLFTVAGTDGIKTGYTRASGFNLVTSVRREGKHVVAVVFGGRTAGERNMKMRLLLAKTWPRASTQKTRRARPQMVARRDTPRSAPAAALRRPAPRLVAPPQPVRRKLALRPSITPAPSPSPAPDVRPAREPVPAATPVARTPTPALGRAPSTLDAQARDLITDQRLWPAPAPRPVAPPRWSEPVLPQAPARLYRLRPAPEPRPAPQPRHQVAARGPVQIQIGAFVTMADARRSIAAAQQKSSGLLAGHPPLTPTVVVARQTYYRARFAGFDASRAEQVCSVLKRQRIECFVVRAE
ncbi:MAG: D-alanyl-D-alanine carboxypeptidase [Hyphomicrobiaceae bacterium]